MKDWSMTQSKNLSTLCCQNKSMLTLGSQKYSKSKQRTLMRKRHQGLAPSNCGSWMYSTTTKCAVWSTCEIWLSHSKLSRTRRLKTGLAGQHRILLLIVRSSYDKLSKPPSNAFMAIMISSHRANVWRVSSCTHVILWCLSETLSSARSWPKTISNLCKIRLIHGSL